MSGRDGRTRDGVDDGYGRGPGGAGADVPRVPVSAGAWGSGSQEALTATPPAAELGGLGTLDDELDGELSEGLLEAPGAWRVGSGAGDGVGLHADADADADADVDAGAKSAGAVDGSGITGAATSAVPSLRADGRLANSRTPQRRSGADPVKVLMHRHRDLCERAVDPLEIAAGLEAHGVTDRTAARFRHKDVFSLAEEMYARVPRDGDPGELLAVAPAEPTGVRGAWAGLALLPGAVCALVLPALTATTGTARLAVGIGGAFALAAALRTTLRHGPLRAVEGPAAPATRLWVWWLLGYALLGDGLLNAALAGGPDEAWAPATAPDLALAVAVAPATWCAHLFVAGARRRLAASRGLAEFASSVRPLLLGCVLLFALALAVLLGLAGSLLGEDADYAAAGALGVLLLLARLLTAHGRAHAPAVVLGAAAAVEALAVALVFAARLPGCDVLGTPVETAVDAAGPGVVPATACAVAALALLVHATRTLTRASAHAHTDTSAGGTP
ncbi:hypothetical protein [Streptomyces sp. NPDC052225]|uniref:hypothetical protein n=1 Tax=Streptomyces sp. NPDC052225 TaxID=3154949 RepID=UPI003414AD0E